MVRRLVLLVLVLGLVGLLGCSSGVADLRTQLDTLTSQLNSLVQKVEALSKSAADQVAVKQLQAAVTQLQADLSAVAESQRALKSAVEEQFSRPVEPTSPSPDLPEGALVIYSVLANPLGSTAVAEIPSEAITILNQTDEVVNLVGLTICDEETCWTIPGSSTPPVVGPHCTWTVTGSVYNPANSARGIALRNSGEQLRLCLNGFDLDAWTYPSGSEEGALLVRPGYEVSEDCL